MRQIEFDTEVQVRVEDDWVQAEDALGILELASDLLEHVLCLLEMHWVAWYQELTFEQKL